MKKKRFKGLFGKCIVFLIIGLNIWFADRVLDTMALVAIEPTVLIGAWFVFTTTELLVMFGIKKDKIKKEGNDNGTSDL
jgi:hypothetical protein